jgi:hypothetical protein
MAEEIDISKALEESLRESRRLQGDQNKELDKSINLLSKINDLRDESIAKVKALNKETVNVKAIEKDVQKAREKQILSQKKEQDLARTLSAIEITNANRYVDNIKERGRLEKETQKARFQGNIALQTQLGSQLNAIDAAILSDENRLNIDERRLASIIEANKVAGETQKILEAELATEKEINSSVGLTGKAFGLLAKKLGIGDKYYGDMVQKARDLNEENKKLSFFDKAKSLGKAAAGGIGTALSDPLTLIPIMATAVGGLVKGLKAALDYILEIQDKTVKFARAMNLSTVEARKIKMEFADLSISSGDIFINSQKMAESQMEMVDALGVTNRLTNEQLATNIKLKDIAGLDLETRKGLYEASKVTGKEEDKITKSILAQVIGLKNATGISFQYQKVLKEASNLGGYLGLSFAKYPEKLTKSLLTVKAMGLELKQLDSMADSFLDYESSIASEFEAQLLTGKNINLAKARELFLNNELAEAAQEINSQVGSSDEFLKMNRISAEALAKSFGMSRDQLGEMLKQQEVLSRVGAKQGDSAKEQLRLGLEKYKNQKALAAAVGEEAYQNLMNASAQEKIAVFIEKITQSFADFVENSGIVGKIEQFVNFLSEPKNVKRVIETIRDVFADIAEVVLSITNGVINVIDFLTFGAFPEAVERNFERYEELVPNRIRNMGGDLGSVSVSGNAAKGNANASTVNVSQGSLGGGAYTGPKVLELNVTGKIMTADDRTFATYSAKGFNSAYGRSDNSTGNFNASN